MSTRSRFWLCAFSVLLCLCGLPGRSRLAAEAGWRALADQEPTQRFRSGIDLVTVDVVVLDRTGEPLQGLTRADFTVLEDGKPQEIREFQSVELPAFAPVPELSQTAPALRRTSPASMRTSPVSINSMTAGRIAGRAFVLVYDDVNLTRNQSAEARRASSSTHLQNGLDAGTSAKTGAPQAGGASAGSRVRRTKTAICSRVAGAVGQ